MLQSLAKVPWSGAFSMYKGLGYKKEEKYEKR